MWISRIGSHARTGWRDVLAVMPVLGLLVGAGAAKSGYGHWAVGAIAMSVPAYFGAVASAMLTRTLATLITQMRRYVSVTPSVARPRGATPKDSQKRSQGLLHVGRARSPCLCWKQAA
jgi:hypothetical protein